MLPFVFFPQRVPAIMKFLNENPFYQGFIVLIIVSSVVKNLVSFFYTKFRWPILLLLSFLLLRMRWFVTARQQTQ